MAQASHDGSFGARSARFFELHAGEVQAVRRGGEACGRAILGGKNIPDRRRITTAGRAVDQCPHDDANHVVQKPVCGNLHTNEIATALHRQRMNGAHRVVIIRRLAAERTEVVRPG